MPGEPRWLPIDVVIETNRLAVSQTGEPFLILSRGNLESACARPKNLWAYQQEEDIASLATVLVAGIAKNHPFQQGNKRTGLLSGMMLIEANGYLVTAPNTVLLGVMLDAVLTNGISETEYADYLRTMIKPV